MMLTVVSESHGGSARRAASILDSYLPRIGSRTWRGEISAEGANDLRTALRAKATKATAVAAHRHGGLGGRSVVAFIVGNRSAFSVDGRVPVAWTRRKRRSTDRTLSGELLAVAVRLAAAFHDLGKLTIGFNAQLLASVEGRRAPRQPVRHELVSIMIIERAIELSGAKSDLAFLELMSTGAGNLFREAAGSFGSGKLACLLRDEFEGRRKSEDNGLDRHLPSRKQGAFPFMRSVVDLVLSHHRLPTGTPSMASGFSGPLVVSVRDSRHVNRVAGRNGGKTAPIGDFLLAAPSAPSALCSGLWPEAVARDARAAASVLRETGEFRIPEWIGATMGLGRLALMLGDHQGSAESRPTLHADPARAVQEQCWANTRSVRAETPRWSDHEEEGTELAAVAEPCADPAQGSGTMLADTWVSHTHKVRRRAGFALAHLLAARDWPGILPDEMPQGLMRRSHVSSPFVWQDHSADLLVGRPTGGAALVLLLASTGTGKTRAIPKIGAALAGTDGMRLNVCLGLRSLTLQTGDEYRERIGFEPDQAMVAIGSRTSQVMHEAERGADMGKAAAPVMDDADWEGDTLTGGSDALREEADLLATGGNADRVLNRMAERLCASDRNRSARQRMLTTPVLVTTLDTLMSAADPRGGGHLGDTVRVSSADLVIDEVDSFSHEDLVAISRLVRLAALHGRSVILASASMRAAHAVVLRDAFAAGRRERASIVGGSPGFDAAWCSEHVQVVSPDDASTSPDTFLAAHQAAALGMAERISDEAVSPTRRRCFVAPVIPGEGFAPHASGSLEAVISLHAENHVTDPATGIRVSVGLVRWNRVRSARAFARHVATAALPSGHALAFACYHAKNALSVRNAVYARIARMLNRKCDQGDPDPLLSNSDIRDRLEAAARSGATDLVCLVSSTNILEAGCDLDADWGIAEPCSERSLLQFAGRIRRHRGWAHAQPNIAILERHVRQGGDGDRLEKPGVETPCPLNGFRSSVYASLGKDRAARAIFPMETWSARVDSAGVLIDARSPSADAEVAMLEGVCCGLSPAALRTTGSEGSGGGQIRGFDASLLSALSARGPLHLPEMASTDLHPRMRRFRRQDGEELQLRPKDGGWLKRDQTTVALAKESKAGRHPVGEWCEAAHIVVERDVPLDADPSAASRLLLPCSCYDIELAASDVEARILASGGDLPRWMRAEIRAVALTLHRSAKEPKVFYEPILGFDTADG